MDTVGLPSQPFTLNVQSRGFGLGGSLSGSTEIRYSATAGRAMQRASFSIRSRPFAFVTVAA
ncbi:MAG: hypothetical protein RI953_1664 [Pseudomonadota bacterium]